MKKFKLEDVKLGRKTDAKIKRQLYIMMFQKKMGNILESFTNISGILKILTPVCVFAFVIFGVNSLLTTEKYGIDTKKEIVQTVDSKSLSQNIVQNISRNKYKKRIQEKERINKYKKYREVALVRSIKARAYKK